MTKRRKRRRVRHRWLRRFRTLAWAVLICAIGGVLLIAHQSLRSRALSRDLRQQYARGRDAIESTDNARTTSAPSGTGAPEGGSTLSIALDSAESQPFSDSRRLSADAETGLPTEAPVVTEPPVITEPPVATEAPVVTEAPSATDDVEAPAEMPGAIAVTSAEGETDAPIVLPDPSEEPEEPVVQDDFTSLYAQNPDLVGWLTLGEHIDEPVLYRDNSYYMDHDFDGNSSISGAVFLDEANDPALSDPMMLIYGHNMRNGTMFGDLDDFRTGSYVAEHPIITLHSIYEPEPRDYVIFSMFDASMNEGASSYLRIRQFDFSSDEAFQAHIDELKSRSFMEIPVDVSADDQLIMLVTCSYSQNNGRFMLIGRKLRPDETPESVSAYFQ